MNTLRLVSAVVLVGLVVFAAVTGCRPKSEPSPPAMPGAEPAPEPEPANDIVDVAIEAGQFETLVAAVKAAGLVETLKGAGPFTVLAPNDEAFAKLPAGAVDDLLKPENKEKLTKILTYHVVPEKVMAADVGQRKSIKTVQGQDLIIDTSDGVKVDGAKVIKADIVTDNGVIHVIDSVVVPK